MPVDRRNPATAVLQFILDNSLLLLAGAAVALVWANVNLAQDATFTGVARFVVNDVGRSSRRTA